MLLAGRCEVFWAEETGGPGFVVRDTEDGLVSVVGRAPEAGIREAAERGSVVISTVEDARNVSRVLPEWSPSRAVLHLPGDSRRPKVPEGGVRRLAPGELDLLEDLPGELRSELEIGVRRSVVAAALAGERPVSFCYAAAETEGLWDLAIDTLARFRRQGLAVRCASYMLRRMEERGKRPVWGAEETNAASLGLARKLGFVPVDEIAVFHPPRDRR